MSPPVRFVSVRPRDGLDPHAVPPWQMVPFGSSKVLRVEHAQGLTIVSTNPSIVGCSIAPNDPSHPRDQVVRLTGNGTHQTTITVSGGLGIVARLQCDVRMRRTVKVAFNFVQDADGRRTRRTVSCVDACVAEMNGIYYPQANIEVVKHSVRTIRVPSGLHRIVGVARRGTRFDEWRAVTTLRDATADFNVFFVWEYEEENEFRRRGARDQREAATDEEGNCLCEDNIAASLGKILSHELGHYFGAADTYREVDRERLMYGYSDGGSRLSKNDVQHMNPGPI